MNYCRNCSQDLGSVAAFDRHRVGDNAYTCAEGLRMDPPREDGRRCLSAREMATLQLTEASGPVFARNKRGAWSLAAGLQSARELR